MDRKYDLIVWGASGFTGRLVVEYLAERYPAAELRWAVGGRNRDKLARVLGDIPVKGDPPDIVVADSRDANAMHDLAASTRVVLTTVGPYARYGTELVAACATAGTDYCDLCGEVQWMRQMIDEVQASAASSGARIVMSCGFDSIPSDIGVHRLQALSLERHGKPCVEVSTLVRAMKGGASGGTYASMLNAIDEARQDRATARVLVDPYALNPEGERSGPDGRDQGGARYDDIADLWTAPFVMATVNTRVVRRTNALGDYPYTRDFRYRESTIAGGRLRATMMGFGLKLFMIAAAVPLTRKLIIKRMLPAPGEGPSREQRENGFFNLLMIGRTADGDEVRLRIKGDRDPGYGSTSKMLAESAICLARGESSAAGGCWTPAAAMGDALLRRLPENAGVTFDPE
jgi:short subunit dehydrogenase-like uncharacterized protein